MHFGRHTFFWAKLEGFNSDFAVVRLRTDYAKTKQKGQPLAWQVGDTFNQGGFEETRKNIE